MTDDLIHIRLEISLKMAEHPNKSTLQCTLGTHPPFFLPENSLFVAMETNTASMQQSMSVWNKMQAYIAGAISKSDQSQARS